VTKSAFSRTFLNQVSHIATSFVTGRVAPFRCCPHHPDKAGFPSVQSRFFLFLTDVRKPEWFRFED
tara:strand:+ start:9474 stop:9671 length:198 start_codon:yes stop_codon:yes gene_type:complete